MNDNTTIDFRQTYWGHNHYLEAQDDGTFAGPCWNRNRICEGDTVLWRTNYGHVVAEVIEVKSYMDPPDMYRIRAVVKKRVADPDIVSQEELDAAFE